MKGLRGLGEEIGRGREEGGGSFEVKEERGFISPLSSL